MLRTLGFLTILAAVLLVGAYSSGCRAAEEVIDPAAAAKDPDFACQGEYVGEGNLFGQQGKIGAQVVALGNGQFDVYLLQGGLPGEGWKKGDKRVKAEAERDGGKVSVKGAYRGAIADGVLAVSGDQAKAELKKIDRKSPTLGAKAPQGAKLLFNDGKGGENFDHATITDLGAMLSGVTTKEGFGDYDLHLEFLLSWMPSARGQGRSNSGVYVHDAYEIQVLDAFGLEGKNNECGGFYSIKEPDVNMCLPPMQWQTYDIKFTAPKYDASGNKTSNARITVKHNGVTIHDDVELPKGTPGRKGEGPAPRQIHLQGHGNKVQYNNIWVQEKKD